MPLACVHIPDYAIWARKQLAPAELNVAVYSDRHIVAVSRTLHQRGLRVGDAVERARAMFPDAQFHPRDRQMEDVLWEDLLHHLAELSPRLLSLQPGWALLEPWDRDGLERVTRSLPAQTGVASRRFMAMLAALHAREEHVLDVPDTMIRRALNQSLVDHLLEFDFDAEMVERLKLLGLTTLGRVWMLTRRHLEAQFGTAGVALFTLLHPADEEPPVPEFQPPPTVSASFDLDYPASEPGELLPLLDHLVRRAVQDLQGHQAQLLTLKLFGCGTRATRRVLKAPTARAFSIFVMAEILLRSLLKPECSVERVVVELGGLLRPAPSQEALFDSRPLVQETVRTLHRRYPKTLFQAIITDPDAHLPEEGVQLKPYPTTLPARSRRRRR